MKPTNYPNIFGVRVGGTDEHLRVDVGAHECDNIEDGVAFQLGNGGWFVVPLSELREIVETAELFRA